MAHQRCSYVPELSDAVEWLRESSVRLFTRRTLNNLSTITLVAAGALCILKLLYYHEPVISCLVPLNSLVGVAMLIVVIVATI